jgi:KaiC/GvpD/RAD55 family RecA-like ATPase
LYNKEHYSRFIKNGSVKGIRDVVTNKVWFDFDTEGDSPKDAQEDAKVLVKRLTDLGIKQKDIQVYFSGNKGFEVSFEINSKITPEQEYNITEKLAEGLTTWDSSLYDANQILRVPGTRHQSSGLFKIPLTVNSLETLTIDEIKKKAESLDNITEEFSWGVVSLPKELLETTPKNKPKNGAPTPSLDFSKKTTGWRNCKWSLLQGNFGSGERHNALMVIAATCRGLGYDKDATYYLCKSAIKKQAALHNTDEFPKEELYKNIVDESVFTDGWEGGQYSCSKPGWLKTYCKSLGEHACSSEEEEVPVITVNEMGSKFKDFSVNFDSNVIKTGLKELDDNLTLSAYTLNGILGQPGSGKTSKSIQTLRNTSENGIQSAFFSMDMGMPIVYAKLAQEATGKSFKEVLDIFKNDPRQAMDIMERLSPKYKHVGFNFKSGLTVPDMKNIVREQQQRTGNPTKLIVIDYLECIASAFSDPTASTGLIANQLKDLATEMQACVILLLQTQKHSTSEVSDPLLSLKNVKGSSIIEQSCSTITTLWREGYSPKTVADDKYISFAVVKNRFGPLWQGDFSWHGVTGKIESLSEEERDRLADFRERKKEARREALESNTKDTNGWT